MDLLKHLLYVPGKNFQNLCSSFSIEYMIIYSQVELLTPDFKLAPIIQPLSISPSLLLSLKFLYHMVLC